MVSKLLSTKTTDLTTGEILDGQLVFVHRKPKSTFSKQGFVIMSNPAMLDLAKLDLSGADARVLFACGSQLDYSNYVRIEQAKLAHQIGLRPDQFTRAVSRLVKQGILLRGPQRTLMLNADYAYRGDAKNQAAINKAQRPFKLIQGGATAPQH